MQDAVDLHSFVSLVMLKLKHWQSAGIHFACLPLSWVNTAVVCTCTELSVQLVQV